MPRSRSLAALPTVLEFPARCRVVRRPPLVEPSRRRRPERRTIDELEEPQTAAGSVNAPAPPRAALAAAALTAAAPAARTSAPG
jgi:hypothetical protein